MVAQIAGLMQMAGLLLMFLGDRIFAAMGMAEPPHFYQMMKENSVMSVLGLFMFSSVAQGLMATGAFEVSLNGQMLFSKLESKRLPNVEELVQSLRAHGVHPFKGALPSPIG